MHSFASLSNTTICCVGPVAFRADSVGPVTELVTFQVADVDSPILVPPPGDEGHLLFLLGRTLRLLQVVELAVQGKDAPAGPRTQVYAYLRQGGVYAELAEIGVLLQSPHRLHCPQGHLTHPGGPTRAPVFEPFRPFFRPPL